MEESKFLNIFLIDDIYLGVLGQEIWENPQAVSSDFPLLFYPGLLDAFFEL